MASSRVRRPVRNTTSVDRWTPRKAGDDSPRVRLEAVRACSFFTTPQAAEVALLALEKEANPDKPDYYIKYCLDETMKALDKYVK